MKPSALIAAAALALMPLVGHSAPYCSDMLDTEKLDKKYRYLAPIFNSRDTGWIFGENQLDRNYEMDMITQLLLMDFVKELRAQGTDLAVLIAPPRPVVAGQHIVDATTGLPGRYWMEEQQFSFALLNRQLNRMGVIAPDLQQVIFSDPSHRDSFYFRRDTHWTNAGAAHSAVALAQMMGKPGFDVASLPVIETFEEPGSLSAVVETTCATAPEAELSTVFEFPAPSGLGLLDDVPEGEVVLLGTSFSDRYRRDAYQVADALSAALETNVTNLAITGGGMIGPMETYILSRRFSEDRPKLIVWEFPYTYPIRERSLRQLLGALRSKDAAHGEIHEASAADGRASFTLEEQDTQLLSLAFDREDVLDVRLELIFSSGRTVELELERKEVMQEVASFDTWWVDLSRMRHGALNEVRVETSPNARRVRLDLH